MTHITWERQHEDGKAHGWTGYVLGLPLYRIWRAEFEGTGFGLWLVGLMAQDGERFMSFDKLAGSVYEPAEPRLKAKAEEHFKAEILLSLQEKMKERTEVLDRDDESDDEPDKPNGGLRLVMPPAKG
jgi:hypothetical protein